MARPFTNSSSANKAFGVFSEPQNAGDYIYNKKAKSTYCNAKFCTRSLTVGSESNYLLFKRAKKMRVYPCLNSINKANLNINLITKLDLTSVPVIQDFSNNQICPTTITTTTTPYLQYNIDPSGNLFGNTICGINNWEKYMVYSNFNITYSLTGTYSITSDSNYNTIITFTNSGTFTITKQSNSIPIYYIVVGGGGGGGGGDIGFSPGLLPSSGAGGGGGGQVRGGVFNSNVVTYVMTVGAGGLGGDRQGNTYTPPSQNGLNGSSSEIVGVETVNGGSYGIAGNGENGNGTGGNSGNGGLGGSGNLNPGGDGSDGGGGGGGGGGGDGGWRGTGGNGSQSSTSVYSYGASFGAGGGGGGSGSPGPGLVLYPDGNAGNSYAGAGGGGGATANYGGGGGGGRTGDGIRNWTSGSNGGSGRIVIYFNNVFL